MDKFPVDPRVEGLNSHMRLPCGQEHCTAFQVRENPDTNQAAGEAEAKDPCVYRDEAEPKDRLHKCSKFMLQIAAFEYKEAADAFKRKLNQLAVDPLTELFTPAARNMLLADLDGRGLLSEMAERNWSLISVYMDLNKLKQFNALGGDEGGDAALEKMGAILRNVFKRSGDITYFAVSGSRALTDVPANAEHAVEELKPHNILVRKGGDEMVGYIFVPPAIAPNQPIMAYINPESSEERRDTLDTPAVDMIEILSKRLLNSLDCARLTFKKTAELGENVIMQDGLKLPYKDLPDGMVEVPLSAIVSLIISPVPRKIEHIHQLTSIIDNKLKTLKDNRTDITTEVVVERVKNFNGIEFSAHQEI